MPICLAKDSDIHHGDMSHCPVAEAAGDCLEQLHLADDQTVQWLDTGPQQWRVFKPC